ncbi:phospholipase a-2-activating protein [Anaeramoeba flamelloides]|uniref:Phospholipase a-2-activating protein n=1 Tax=Anaeramoeba flamelloides TaxID=1746091 RepID=A0AAV8A958_9EUKA|nr:phospholipase a-2-activating protein [Anaeramoeba flamelloides]
MSTTGPYNLSFQLKLSSKFLSSISTFISGNIVAASGTPETISIVYAIEKGAMPGLEEETFLACSGQMMMLYSIQSILKMSPNQEPKAIWWIFGHSANISCVTVCPNGLIYSGSYDQTIHVDQYTNKEKKIILKGHTGTVNNLIHINNTVISSSTDDTIRIWKNFQQVKVITNEMTRNVSSIAPCYDYGFFSTNNTNESVCFDLKGKIFFRLFLGNSKVNRVSSSPLGLKEYYLFGQNACHFLSYSETIATPKMTQHPRFIIPYTRPKAQQGKNVDPNDHKDLYEKCYGEDVLLAFSDGDILFLTKNKNRTTHLFSHSGRHPIEKRHKIRDVNSILERSININNQIRVGYDFNKRNNNNQTELDVLCFKNKSQTWAKIGKITCNLDFVDIKKSVQKKIEKKNKKKNQNYGDMDEKHLTNTLQFLQNQLLNMNDNVEYERTIAKFPYNSSEYLPMIKEYALHGKVSKSNKYKLKNLQKFAKKELRYFKNKLKKVKGYERILSIKYAISGGSVWIGFNIDEDTQETAIRVLNELDLELHHLPSISQKIDQLKVRLRHYNYFGKTIPKRKFESFSMGNIEQSLKQIEVLNTSTKTNQITENEMLLLKKISNSNLRSQNNIQKTDYQILAQLLKKCTGLILPTLLDLYRLLILDSAICKKISKNRSLIKILLEQLQTNINDQNVNLLLAYLNIFLNMFSSSKSREIIFYNRSFLLEGLKKILSGFTDYKIQKKCLQILLNLSIQCQTKLKKYHKYQYQKKIKKEIKFLLPLLECLVGYLKLITDEDLLSIIFLSLGTLIYAHDSVIYYLISKNFLYTLQKYRKQYGLLLSTIIDEIIQKVVKLQFK